MMFLGSQVLVTTLSKAWLCKATIYLFITYAVTLAEGVFQHYFKVHLKLKWILYQIKQHAGYFYIRFSQVVYTCIVI